MIRILQGCTFSPEASAKFLKKRVATNFEDLNRIQNNIIKDPDKFTIIFKLGLSQKIDNFWKKCVVMKR